MRARLRLALGFWLACAPASAGVVDVVRDFGAKGDGVSDDWEAIQRAVGMQPSGYCVERAPTIVAIPPTKVNKYRISQAIRLCSNVTLKVVSNDTEIDFTGDAKGRDYTGAEFMNLWPGYGATLAGNITADLATPALPIAGAVEAGATRVTLARAEDAGQLRVGDIVDVETVAAFSLAGATPTRLRAAVVSALAAGGAVDLDRAVDFAAQNVQLRRLTNLANTPGWPTMRSAGHDTHAPIFAVRGCGVIGGRWKASSAAPNFQPFNGAGGILDCVISPDEVIAGFGVGYGNLMQDSTLSARRETIQTTAFEAAYNSSRTRTTLGVVRVADGIVSRPGSPWMIGFDEGSHDNVLEVASLEDGNSNRVAEWALAGEPKGGETAPVTVTTPGPNGGEPIKLAYAVKAVDSRADVAAGVAAALNADARFAAAGFSATANPISAAGSVIVTNRSPGVVFYLGGGAAGGSLVAYSSPLDIVRIMDAYDNRVRIGALSGPAVSGFLVDMIGHVDRPAVPPTRGNRVSIGRSDIAYQQSYVRFRGKSTLDNAVNLGSAGPHLYENRRWLLQEAGDNNTVN